MREDCMEKIFSALFEIVTHAAQDPASRGALMEDGFDCIQRLIQWADINFVMNETCLSLVYSTIANENVSYTSGFL